MKSRQSLYQGYAIQHYILTAVRAIGSITRDDCRLLFKVPSKVITRQVERLSEYLQFDDEDRIVLKPYCLALDEKIEELQPFRALSLGQWLAGEAPRETITAAEEYLGVSLPQKDGKVLKADLQKLESQVPVLKPLTAAFTGRPDYVFYLGEYLRADCNWHNFKSLHPEITAKQHHALETQWQKFDLSDETICQLQQKTIDKLIAKSSKILKKYLASDYEPSESIPNDLYEFAAEFVSAPAKKTLTAAERRKLLQSWKSFTESFSDDAIIPDDLQQLLPSEMIITARAQFHGDLSDPEVLEILERHRADLYSTYDGVYITNAAMETFLADGFYLLETADSLYALPESYVNSLKSQGRLLQRELTYVTADDGSIDLQSQLKAL